MYLYDGYFKLVVNFTGKNRAYKVPFSIGTSSTDTTDLSTDEVETSTEMSTEEMGKGLYKRTFAPP